MERMSLLGAWVAQAIFILSILVFVARLAGRPGIEYWIGVASAAGKPWAISSIALFLAMAVLAFAQRIVTGMQRRDAGSRWRQEAPASPHLFLNSLSGAIVFLSRISECPRTM